MIALTALNAALYAITAYATAYIESPWGHGQFRPAIVIPALFATIFGPWVGGIGAAIGTLICDSFKHGTLYMPSLIAAVPANFLAFFLYGYILRKRFTWDRFVMASVLSLFIGNFVCAILLVWYYTLWIHLFTMNTISEFILLSLGLTAWWFITMLPFQLLITPFLVKIVVRTIPSVVLNTLKISLGSPLPMKRLSLALLVPGLIMFLIGVLLVVHPSVGLMLTGGLKNAEMLASLIKVMFLITGLSAIIIGIIFLLTAKLRMPS